MAWEDEAELVSEPAAASSDAHVSAFLSALRAAEGTASEDGYRTMFGGGKFNDFTDHPRKRFTFKETTGRENTTTAAGAYQFLASTWDRVAKKLQLPDFSPESQDRAAIELIREAGALEDVKAGRFEDAMRKVAPIWASLPDSPYPQGKRSPEFMRTALDRALKNVGVDPESITALQEEAPAEERRPFDTTRFDVAGARKEGYSDAEIVDYLGGRSGFDVKGARDEGYKDSEILAYLVPPERDVARGAETAFKQTPAILKGAVGLLGATAEQTFGEGGISTAIKEWGLNGFQDGMAKLKPLSRQNDDVTVALERAKEGDWGALIDWAQYAFGYGMAQVAETVAVGLASGLAGGAMTGGTGAIPSAIAGMLSKDATKGAIRSLVEREIKRRAGEGASEEALKLATKSVARDIGAVTGLTAWNMGIEAGSIYGEAVEEAQGRELSGADLARIYGAATVAGASETIPDVLGLGALAGRFKSALPGGSRAARAGVGAGIGIGVEAGQETFQTAVERYGAQKDLTGEEATREYLNAAAMAAVPGGVVGGVMGALSSEQTLPIDRRLLRDERAAHDDAARIMGAPTLDAALDEAFAATARARQESMAAAQADAGKSFVDEVLGRAPEIQPGDEDALRTATQADDGAGGPGAPIASQLGAAPARPGAPGQPGGAADQLAGAGLAAGAPGRLAPDGTPAEPAAGVAGAGFADRDGAQADQLAAQGLASGGAARPGLGQPPAGVDPYGRREPTFGTVDEDVHQAATSPLNDRTATDAMLRANNAKLGRTELPGIEIKVKYPSGSERVDEKNDPPRFRTVMQGLHYGEVADTRGYDGMAIDIAIAEGTSRTYDGPVFVLNQLNDDGSFDEHKVFAGPAFASEKDVRRSYINNFGGKKAEKRIGHIQRVSYQVFKDWAFSQRPLLGEFRLPPTHYIDDRLLVRKLAPGEQVPKGVRTFSDFESARTARVAELKARAQAKKQIDVNVDSLIPAIIKLGGINMSERNDVIGDKGNVSISGVGHLFTSKGDTLDGIVRRLAEYGYMTQSEIDDATDTDGTRLLVDRIQAEMVRGKKHFAVSKDFTEEGEELAYVGPKTTEQVETMASALVDAETRPDDWDTLSPEEQDAQLDATFGPTEGAAPRPQESEGTGAGTLEQAGESTAAIRQPGERQPGEDDDAGDVKASRGGDRREINKRVGDIFAQPEGFAEPPKAPPKSPNRPSWKDRPPLSSEQMKVGQRVENERGTKGEIVKVTGSPLGGLNIEVMWDKTGSLPQVTSLIMWADREHERLRDWERLKALDEEPKDVPRETPPAPRLNEAEKAALEKLSDTEWLKGGPLGLQSGVLQGLERKGLVESTADTTTELGAHVTRWRKITPESKARKEDFAREKAARVEDRRKLVSELEELVERDGGARAVDQSGRAVLLSRGMSGEKFRVTSLDPGGTPTGHREYDSIRAAAIEFNGMRLDRPGEVLAPYTKEDLRKKEEQAKRGDVESRAPLKGDTAPALTPPAGTAPPAKLAPQPTVQRGLFSGPVEERGPIPEMGKATPIDPNKPIPNPVNGEELYAEPDRTLVCMACSATKIDTKTSVPLIELYNGPLWQTLRKHLGKLKSGQVMVLSGKHLWTDGAANYLPYDERISKQKVDELIRLGADGQRRVESGPAKGSVTGFNPVQIVLSETDYGRKPYKNVIIVGSGEYERAFHAAVTQLKEIGYVADDAAIVQTKGGIGEQRQQLGEFLDDVNGKNTDDIRDYGRDRSVPERRSADAVMQAAQRSGEFADLRWRMEKPGEDSILNVKRPAVVIENIEAAKLRSGAGRRLLQQLKETGVDVIPEDIQGDEAWAFWTQMAKEGLAEGSYFLDDETAPAPTESDQTAEAVYRDMSEMIAAGEGNAILLDNDQVGAFTARLVKEGWEANKAGKSITWSKDGWEMFLRSQGEHASTIVQWGRKEFGPRAKQALERANLEAVKQFKVGDRASYTSEDGREFSGTVKSADQRVGTVTIKLDRPNGEQTQIHDGASKFTPEDDDAPKASRGGRVEQPRGVYTGSAWLRGYGLSPAQRAAVEEAINRRADASEVRDQLVRHFNTPWAEQAVQGVLVRIALDDLAAGRKPSVRSLLDSDKVANLRALADEKGAAGIWQYLHMVGLVGEAGKPVNSVNSSFLNCRPSDDCAIYCYATKGNYRYVNPTVKSELTNWAVENDPKRAAKLIAAEYKSTAEFYLNKALRLFDKGDGNEAWLPAIRALNAEGVRVQIFSKNPAFLREVPEMNVRLLSADKSNLDVVRSNPDLPVAFVYSDPSQIEFLNEIQDRVQVILPVKQGAHILSKSKIDALPQWTAPYVCPVDKGVVKVGKQKGEWNCTRCDYKGGVGCFFGQVTDAVMKAISAPVRYDAKLAEQVKEIENAARRLPAAERAKLLGALDRVTAAVRAGADIGSEGKGLGSNEAEARPNDWQPVRVYRRKVDEDPQASKGGEEEPSQIRWERAWGKPSVGYVGEEHVATVSRLQASSYQAELTGDRTWPNGEKTKTFAGFERAANAVESLIFPKSRERSLPPAGTRTLAPQDIEESLELRSWEDVKWMEQRDYYAATINALRTLIVKRPDEEELDTDRQRGGTEVHEGPPFQVVVAGTTAGLPNGGAAQTLEEAKQIAFEGAKIQPQFPDKVQHEGRNRKSKKPKPPPTPAEETPDDAERVRWEDDDDLLASRGGREEIKSVIAQLDTLIPWYEQNGAMEHARVLRVVKKDYEYLRDNPRVAYYSPPIPVQVGLREAFVRNQRLKAEGKMIESPFGDDPNMEWPEKWFNWLFDKYGAEWKAKARAAIAAAEERFSSTYKADTFDTPTISVTSSLVYQMDNARFFIQRAKRHLKNYEDDTKASRGSDTAADDAEAMLAMAQARSQRGVSQAEAEELLVEAFGPGVRGLFERKILNFAPNVDGLPERLRRAFEQGVEAFYHRGAAWLIGSELTPERVVPVVLHEIGEHYGLKEMLGERGYRNLVNALHGSKSNPAVAAAFDHVARKYRNLDPKGEAFASEVIARIGESGEGLNLPFFKRVLAAIREFLIRLGLAAGAIRKLSDRDIALMVTASARRAMAGEEPRAYATGREVSEAPAGADRDGQVAAGERDVLAPEALSTRSSGAAPAPVWFSALEKAVAAKGPNSAAPAQWASFIKNAPGVKKEELEWSGLLEWLDMHDRLTKDEVIGFLRETGVQIEEKMLGAPGDPKLMESVRERDDVIVNLDARGYEPIWTNEGLLYGVMHRGSDTIYRGYGVEHNDAYSGDMDEKSFEQLPFPGLSTLRRLVRKLQELAPITRAYGDGDEIGTAATRFDSWKEPGGTDYRELLLTIPHVSPKSRQRLAFQKKMAAKYGESWSPQDLTPEEKEIGGELFQEAGKAVTFNPPHFDTPNLLAHVRFDERTDAEGKRVLFIEEFQSDWAERGREYGFKGGEKHKEAHRRYGQARMTWEHAQQLLADVDMRWTGDQTAWAVYDPAGNRLVPSRLVEVDGKWDVVPWSIRPEHEELVRGKYETAEEAWEASYQGGGTMPMTKEQYDAWIAFRVAREAFNRAEVELYNDTRNTVPRAPFVEKTDAWVALLAKRMIRYAAENGFERIAWTTGKQQGERYSLRKHVDRIELHTFNSGERILFAFPPRLRDPAISRPITSTKDLEDLVGKEMAEKLMAQPNRVGGTVGGQGEPRGIRKLANIDLEIGGEGMIAFYDRIVPNIVNDVLKKLGGGRVGKVTMSMVPAVNREHPEYGYEERSLPRETMQQPGFDITPELRDAALQGMPMFSRDGKRSWMDAVNPPDWDDLKEAKRAGPVMEADKKKATAAQREKLLKMARKKRREPQASRGGWQRAPHERLEPWMERFTTVQRDGKWRVAGARNLNPISPAFDTEKEAEDWARAFHEDTAPKASRGGFNPQADMFGEPREEGPDLVTVEGRKDLAARARSMLGAMLNSERTFNWWHRSVGTQYHKAQISAPFRKVFEEGQDQITDTNRFSMQSEEKAPDILLRLEAPKELFKRPASQEDLKAAGAALFKGTLWGGASPLQGRVFEDQELRTMFRMTDKQIGLYRQVRAAVDTSVETMAKSVIARLARTYEVDVDPDMSLEDVAALVDEQLKLHRDDVNLQLEQVGEETVVEPGRPSAETLLGVEPGTGDKYEALSERAKLLMERDAVNQAIVKVQEVQNRALQLQKAGYMPLMRFGQFWVNVKGVDASGNPQEKFFGMYETEAERDRAAEALRKEFPESVITKGIHNDLAYRIFKGISPETIQLFADVAGLDDHPLMQKFVQLAVSDRSALKRLLERKGTPGWSWDIPRVLAQFITSNARTASANYHHAAMLNAIQEIPDRQGDVGREATRLYEYLTDPHEEAAALRGYLFFHFLGGSFAAGAVNMTQPVLVTAPYLAQFANAGRVAAEMLRAARDAAKASSPKDAAGQAMQRATTDGIVAPHEIYQLMAEARGGIGRSIALRQLTRLWGGLFSLAEAWNRRTTFLAAYRIAEANKVDDPYAFATRAVHETQFIYNKGNRPNWARGAVGATIFTFKQFSVSYLEFLKRLPVKQRLLALGILVLAAGLQGLPGADDLDDILDTIGQWMGYATNTKKWKRKLFEDLLGKEAAQFVLHGTSTLPGMPLDVQMRLGLGNLIPGTSIFKPSDTSDKGREIAEVLGPAGGLVESAFKVARAAFQGDVSEAAKAGLPVALRNAYQALEMFQTGQYRDQRGRRVVDVDGVDAMVKAIGFNPASVARESRKIGEAMTDVSLQRTTEDAIAEKWARGVIDKDPALVEEAKAEMRAWNARNPELRVVIKAEQIMRRVRDARRSREERFTRSAAPEIRRGVREELRQ